MNVDKIKINRYRERKYLSLVFIGLFLFVMIMFAAGEMLLPDESMKVDAERYILDDCVYYINDSGERESVSTPEKLAIPKGDTFVVEIDVPEMVVDNDIIVFWNYWHEVKAYLKDTGDVLLEYKKTDSQWMGNNAISRYLDIRLNGEMAGKTIVLELSCNNIFSGEVSNFYIGNDLKVWSSIVNNEVPSVIIALVLIVYGAGIMIICEMLGGMVFKKHVSLSHLGWAIIYSGSFVLFESGMRQFFFRNVSWAAFLSIVLIPMTAFAVILFMNEIQRLKYQGLYRVLLVAMLVAIFGGFSLHFAGVYDLSQSMTVIFPLAIITGLVIVGTIIKDIKDGDIHPYMLTAIGFFTFVFMCLLETYFSFRGSSFHAGAFVSVGIVAMSLLSIYNSLFRLIDNEIEKMNKIREGEQKSAFLAQVSHEIRTPINGVLGMNEMIMRESTEDNIKEYAFDINNLGNLLLALINDLLDFSKIEAGKMELLPIEYELSSTLDGVITSLRPKALEKSLDFEIDVDEETPEYLYGDEIRIRQIMTNIVNNAIKYTDKGSVKLAIKKQYIESRKINLIIEVSDTGKGIKEEDIPYLFDTFTRADEKRNAHIEGTGLGLAISAKFVELMQGEITVTSEYGKGSVFTVVLPQRVIKKEPIGNFKERVAEAYKGQEKYEESFKAPNARILVVDDNKTNLKLAELLLKKTEIQVKTALSGAETLNILENESFDLILLDHMMPGMDGIETLEEINKRYPERDFPVIALTANAVAGAREKYLKHGFEDYMSKPMNGKTLEAMLIKWLPKDVVQTK
ncbi:MAG: response regulator [Lachnospiraceae bacterium]|nr:response regulator [Lachnospiraceae bacterium]